MSSVIPAFGVVVSCGLFSSALPATLRARKTGVLHQDPTPSVVTLISCLLWVLYASMIGDLWIFSGSGFGVIVNSFNTCIAMRLAGSKQTSQRIEAIFCIGVSVLAASTMMLASPTVILDFGIRVRVVSAMCMAVCLVMFASPLVQAWQAFSSGDASRINIILTTMQLLNGVLWTSYGLSQGDMTLIVPNGAAILLAFINLLVKLYLLRRELAAPSGPRQDHPIKALLEEATTSGRFVTLRSIWFPGCHLCVPGGEANLDAEQQNEFKNVRGDQLPSALQVVPTGGHNEVYLRTVDGLFLQLRPQLAITPDSSGVQPSQFSVVAAYCADPGPEGRFVPVHAPAVEAEESASGIGLHRNFGEDSVGFYNPTHGVFIRLNEKGWFDSSPRCFVDTTAQGSPTSRMPVGWTWERFVVQAALSGEVIGLEPSSIGARRRRATSKENADEVPKPSSDPLSL
mmetsp:Transcript_49394/g.159406  ORF Transcript_49394/g.159406 Transcript_49394/m.159406 type:complete len:456 (+) Transcript_49394:30-1397(+)|eukprot:CAMPEP_0203871046 /NCGR_PEP_ID=MMETSP0359-20131031/18539_1 /ASSEMBLY_ACC=CAM_ASM_000338 /TAXON_ID=268821 /ORGANISM="Scrippsiella Hangoei, Strain SHTV-5" /LENGTH=455 /DNA_ID=CAMNT_0050789717 /DNA_START=86 /DNA_END=1453 /DNA_ORIENTATION=+